MCSASFRCTRPVSSKSPTESRHRTDSNSNGCCPNRLVWHSSFVSVPSADWIERPEKCLIGIGYGSALNYIAKTLRREEWIVEPSGQGEKTSGAKQEISLRSEVARRFFVRNYDASISNASSPDTYAAPPPPACFCTPCTIHLTGWYSTLRITCPTQQRGME